MPEEDRNVVGGIPCTSIERTLLDVGAVVRPRKLEALVVEACREATTIARLRERLSRPAGGRSGGGLRKLLDQWGDLSPPESVIESSLRRLMRRHRLPLGHPQWPVVDHGRIVARVDIAYPDRRVAIEADGYRWHGDTARWRDDLARRNRLAQLGWRVLHFTWTDVHRHPERVAHEIRTALRA